MWKHLFLWIIDALDNHDVYFQTRFNATDRMGLSPLKKCIAAIHALAYELLVDSVDDYARIGETTIVECLERFVRGVNEIFGVKYLRRPNNNDIQYLLQMGEARGFPGMLGSIDCMYLEWKNCLIAWKGQYTRGDDRKSTIILKVVAL